MSSRLLGSLKKFYRKIFKDTPNVKTKIKIATERHGSVYGGWHIKRDSLNRDSVVYSVGIGKDISFDISVIEKYGCLIYGYDPTPGLDEWVKLNQVNSLFKFFPYGLSDKNGKLKFYKPKVKGNISHSTEIADHTDSEYFEVPCLTLEQMIFDNKHSKIDLLKMDIEGEELKVIDYILSSNLNVEQLLIEFHHFFSSSSSKVTEEYVQKLEMAGYKLFYISDSFCEYSFIKV